MKKNRRKRLLWILLCLVWLTGCGKSTKPDSESQKPELPQKEEETSIDVTENENPISITLERIDASWTYEAEDGTLLLSSNIYYPQVTVARSPEASEKINTVFKYVMEMNKENAQEEISWAEEQYQQMIEEGQKEYFWNYAYDLDYIVTFQGENMLCVKFVQYSYMGGAHPNSTMYMYHFDLNSGECLTSYQFVDTRTGEEVSSENQLTGTMVEEGAAFEAFLEDKVTAYFAEQQLEDGTSLVEELYPNYQDVIHDNIANPCWYISEDSLWIVYGEYEIAPYAAGTFEIEIPLVECESYWSDYGRSLLQVK